MEVFNLQEEVYSNIVNMFLDGDGCLTLNDIREIIIDNNEIFGYIPKYPNSKKWLKEWMTINGYKDVAIMLIEHLKKNDKFKELEKIKDLI